MCLNQFFKKSMILGQDGTTYFDFFLLFNYLIYPPFSLRLKCDYRITCYNKTV